MTNTYKVILVLILGSFSGFAQNLNIEWAKSTSVDGQKFKIDNSDNVIVSGSFDNTVDFDPGPGVFNMTSPGNRSFIYKLDSSGNFLWAFMYVGNSIDVSNIVINPSGSFHAVVSSVSTYDADPGPGVVNLSGDCIIKYSASGQYISHRQGIPMYNILGFYNSNFVLYKYSTTPIDIDPGPGTFLTAANSVTIANYDTSMNFVSAINYPHASSVSSIKMDPNGDFLISQEYYSATSDLIPGTASVTLPLVIPITGGTDFNYYIARTDHTFNPIYTTAFGVKSGGSTYDVASISDGSVIVTIGVTDQDTIYPAIGSTGIRIVNTSAAYEICSFIKYNNSGQYVRYVKTAMEDYVDVEIDVTGRMYVTGMIDFTSNWDFDPSTGNYTIQNNDPGCGNIYVAMYDTAFAFKGAYMMGGTFCDTPQQLTTRNNGGQFYLSAIHSNGLDVDVTYDTYLLPDPVPSTNNGYFVAKYNTSTLNNVWPGDANQDLIVDNFDVLSIGLYNGQVIDKRFIISNAWQPYFAFNNGTQYNGNDKKYADCNGNGTISISDTVAIRQNYGLSHVLRQAQSMRTSVGPDLYFQTSAAAVGPGSIVNVDIMAGTQNLSLYGIGFNIPIDPSLIQPGSVSMSFTSSWLGTPGTNAIGFGKFTGTSADGTLVRNNSVNATGYGKIATLTFQISNNISVPTVFPLSFSNHLALTANGVSVSLTPLTSSFLIDPSLDLPSIDELGSISINPNVTSGMFSLILDMNNAAEVEFTLINTIGELILIPQKHQIPQGTFTKEFNISNLNSGIYFLKTSINGNEKYHRIMKL